MDKSVNFNLKKCVDRRTLLRGTGIAMALPWLSAMQPAHAASKASVKANRFVSFTMGLGVHGPNLNPTEKGKNYKPSRYTKSIDDIRDKFTIISGASHPGVGGGHRAEANILSAAPTDGSGRTKNTISFDQYLAKHLGNSTRFPSLVLGLGGPNSPSYTETGAMIPAENSPTRLFEMLFVNESNRERRRRKRLIHDGRSIMDLVNADAKQLQRELGKSDLNKLDNYFTSVRELEKRMASEEAWATRPKPKVKAKKPVDKLQRRDLIGRQKMMSDVIGLALQTDSSRFISFHFGSGNSVIPIKGVAEGYHSLSHHGKDEEKLEQLAIIEASVIAEWGEFLRKLAAVEDENGNLLDQTNVLLTSNLGNASNHSNRNMPVLFGGGGFQHGQHLAFDQNRNYPLSNLFVSMMQQIGMEQSKFSTGKSTMTGLV